MPKVSLPPRRQMRAQRQAQFAAQRDLAGSVATVETVTAALGDTVTTLDTRVADLEGTVEP